MTPASSRSPLTAFRRWPAEFPRLCLTLAGVALTVFFYAPVSTVMDALLDSSNYASYTYFAARQFQYGPEVVPMSGPYGFVMYGSTYNGELFWTRLIGQLVSAAALSAFILWFFHQARGTPLRWLWLGLLLLFTPVIEDLPLEWMILLAGLFLLQRGETRPATGLLVATATLLAFVSLIKGTHLVLAVATLGVVLGRQALARDWHRCGWIAGSYLAAFLGFWLLAGQHPANVPSFLQGIRALTDGYNDAMSLDESARAFRQGLLTLAILAAALVWGTWQRWRNPGVIAGALLFAGFTFVKWKHGFVRADGHVYIFHHYAVAAITAWFIFVFALHRGDRPEPRRTRLTAAGLMAAGILAGIWMEGGASLLRLRWLVVEWTPQRIALNVRQLLAPAQAKAEFDRQLETHREHYRMPLTRQQAGDQPIDLFGIQHGIVPLNGLNYRPRPMGGGAFNAYNPYLMGLNRDFIRDPERRPDHYLLRFETIDNRLATQDDGLTLLEILHHYQPLLIEQGHVLMKEEADPEPVELRPLSHHTFRFGEFVPVPAVGPDELLVARFDVRPNLQGRLRSFLYKAPLMFMTLQGRGIENPESRRFIPGMAVSPFLFSPAIEDNSDLAYLYTRREGKQVTGFFIYSNDPGCFQEELAVEFFTTPRPQADAALDIDELLTFTRFPISNVPPEVVIPATEQQTSVRGLQVQRLHAPGEIHWRMQGNESEFIFDYGFIPEAYERGTTNGAVFIVELRREGRPPERLFEQLLDPVNNPADRGNRTARVELADVNPGSRLVLRTDPGEHGDTSWDWAYVTRMQLKRSHVFSRDFPVFSRVPDEVDGQNVATIEMDERPVFLLHVPASLTFTLNGGEQNLYLEFGFMPGAHTGEGRTDGADYVVELLRPGQPRQEIYRRTLRPTTVPSDRGRHSTDITLPAVNPGDRLIVRTGVVEGGNESWGWTYVSRLTID